MLLCFSIGTQFSHTVEPQTPGSPIYAGFQISSSIAICFGLATPNLLTQRLSSCAGRSLQGFSRFDAMIRLTRSIRYTHLRSCGHLTFVGAPLETDLTLVGCPLLTLWVESSDSDADIFAYLEDQDPETGKARYAAGLPLLAPIIPGGAWKSWLQCSAY